MASASSWRVVALGVLCYRYLHEFIVAGKARICRQDTTLNSGTPYTSPSPNPDTFPTADGDTMVCIASLTRLPLCAETYMVAICTSLRGAATT